jgi:hypothetical protein
VKLLAALAAAAVVTSCTEHASAPAIPAPQPDHWHVIASSSGMNVWRWNSQTGALESCIALAGPITCTAPNMPSSPGRVRTWDPSMNGGRGGLRD